MIEPTLEALDDATTAAQYAIRKALESGDGKMLRAIKTLMEFQSARAEVAPRDAVLEEAAKACDAVRTKLITDDADYGAFTCAAAIRTLKSKPSAVSETATKAQPLDYYADQRADE